MTSMPWIKSYTKKLDDIRIARTSPISQLAFFKLELLAGKCDEDGALVMNGEQLTEEEIAFIIRMDVKDVRKAIKELVANRLIHLNGRGPQLIDFPAEQVSQQQRRDAWRERQDRHRHVTSDTQDVTRDSDVNHALRTRVQNKSKNKRREEKKRKEPATPTPPKNKGARAQVGRQDNDIPSLPDLLKTDKKAYKRAELAMKILRSSGLGNPKLKQASVKLAIRNYKSEEQFRDLILAALASTYSDPTAENKSLVAIYRLENDQVPPQFKDRATWKVIPHDVLDAANVKDPQAQTRREKYTTEGWIK